MTKAELIKSLESYPDDTPVMIEDLNMFCIARDIDSMRSQTLYQYNDDDKMIVVLKQQPDPAGDPGVN